MRENHNFLCDQRLSAASRARWLNLGRLLAKRNSLESAEMVVYLTPTELIETLEGAEGPNANEIHERRLLQQAVRETPPPAVLGKPLDEPERSRDRPIQLAGVAASPGPAGADHTFLFRCHKPWNSRLFG